MCWFCVCLVGWGSGVGCRAPSSSHHHNPNKTSTLRPTVRRGFGKKHQNCQKLPAGKTFIARARLVKGTRWYIDYTRFDAETGAETRHRQDFDLNDIKDLAVRAQVAARLVANIDLFAKPVIPKNRQHFEKPESHTVRQAVEWVVALKMALPRKNSRKTYKAMGGKLLTWCTRLHYADMPAPEFGKKQSRAFWDGLVSSGDYKGRSLNNYLVCLRTLWNEMMARDMVTENPWTRIKPERVGEKSRRPFTQEERRIVAAHIEVTDYWMFRGVLLQFFCYIRPVEMLRMRFKNFDLGRGVVTVESADAKTWRRRTVTIPQSVLYYFRDGVFDKQPGNYFLFGRKQIGPHTWLLQPSTTPVSECRMNKRHRRVLERLKADGRLTGDISGLSWYSWKDTGISLHTRKTSPVATKDQAGHADLSITSVYYHAEEMNMEYRALENDLFG